MPSIISKISITSLAEKKNSVSWQNSSIKAGAAIYGRSGLEGSPSTCQDLSTLFTPISRIKNASIIEYNKLIA